MTGPDRFSRHAVGISPLLRTRKQEVRDMTAHVAACTVAGTDRAHAAATAPPVARRPVRLGRFGLGAAGVLALLVSAWGGIVPFVGSLFSFSGDGSGSWHGSLAPRRPRPRPGRGGYGPRFFVLAESRGVTVGKGRLSLASADVLLMACGAWFAIPSRVGHLRERP